MTPAKVAALYVLPDGPYANRPDVDVWDEARDARTYDGPFVVVAHPPCQRWGRFANAYGKTRGDDAGCFAAALASVRRWGGVLEHPEASSAWEAFALPRPTHGAGWTRSLFDPGWSCSVDQGLYGHLTRKRTWLYYCGKAPPAELGWADGGQGSLAEVLARGEVYRYVATNKRTRRLRALGVPVRQLVERERLATPPAFVEALLGLARGAA